MAAEWGNDFIQETRKAAATGNKAGVAVGLVGMLLLGLAIFKQAPSGPTGPGSGTPLAVLTRLVVSFDIEGINEIPEVDDSFRQLRKQMIVDRGKPYTAWPGMKALSSYVDRAASSKSTVKLLLAAYLIRLASVELVCALDEKYYSEHDKHCIDVYYSLVKRWKDAYQEIGWGATPQAEARMLALYVQACDDRADAYNVEDKTVKKISRELVQDPGSMRMLKAADMPEFDENDVYGSLINIYKRTKEGQ